MTFLRTVARGRVVVLVLLAAAVACSGQSPRHGPADRIGVRGGYAMPPRLTQWPGPSNTGVPPHTRLRPCPSVVSRSGLYDGCRFIGAVKITADNVTIARSRIDGIVLAGSGDQQHGLTIVETTIDATGHGSRCTDGGCVTPAAVSFANFTLTRVDISGSGHGVQISGDVRVVDSWIHDLCCLNAAHKDGIISNGGSHVVLDHNNVACDVGTPGVPNFCSAAIGLFGDFAPLSDWRVTSNLLNTTGSYCLYGGSDPRKRYGATGPMTFRGNVFGDRYYQRCGRYGAVAALGSGHGWHWSGNKQSSG